VNAPSGVVTFLFTDIEGSTRRWEADADVMRAAVELHNQVLRKTVEAHQGQVFNYTGDGMCAVFSSPRSAVDAAVAAQLALELPVRMGIATGEAELRGADYFGTVLNRTARVMAAGHGGQILLDGATASLLSGVDLISLGPRRLRDIAKPVDVFQMQAVGLRTDFPPLKTVDPARGNLRPRNTTFIGREAELIELAEVLKAHQLVTLTGVGGVGKGVGDRAGRGWRSSRGARRRRGRNGYHPTTWHEHCRQRRGSIGRQVTAADLRQLRTRARRRGRHHRGDPGTFGHGENPLHQPRRTPHRRRTALASNISGRSQRTRLVGCLPIL
jgi:hypothetical protein